MSWPWLSSSFAGRSAVSTFELLDEQLPLLIGLALAGAGLDAIVVPAREGGADHAGNGDDDEGGGSAREQPVQLALGTCRGRARRCWFRALEGNASQQTSRELPLDRKTIGPGPQDGVLLMRVFVV